MTSITEDKCPECGKEAAIHYENNVLEAIMCEHCDYYFDIPAENQGNDQEAWKSYPEGWSCIMCGESYAGIKPILTEDGTTCRECTVFIS